MFSISKLLFFIVVISKLDSLVINENDNGLPQNELSNRAIADCTNWYKKQINADEHLRKTLKPPCRIPSTFPKKLIDGWSVDPGCDASKQPNTCGYHPGAHGCYRHSHKSSGPGAQSCYDKTGVWLADPKIGAGTLDVETPLGSFIQQLKHYQADVKPYTDCCPNGPLSNTCDLYYEKRPPGECENKPAV
jgi:hypothetical protein